MKKSVLYFVFSVLFVFMTGFAFAQCTPDVNVVDPDGTGRMDPDTLHVNSGDVAGISITVICPLTGDAGGGNINIHHIKVTSLLNQPAWLTYVCNPGNCELNAGVRNCVWVSSPSSVPSGDDTIYMDVLVDVYMDLGGVPVGPVASNFNGGTIVLIRHPEGYGVTENAKFDLIAPQPNPFNSTVKLGCYTEKSQEVSLKIFDMIGKEVYSEKMIAGNGENFFIFDGSNLNDGVYFYSVIDSQNRIITKKLVKSR